MLTDLEKKALKARISLALKVKKDPEARELAFLLLDAVRRIDELEKELAKLKMHI